DHPGPRRRANEAGREAEPLSQKPPLATLIAAAEAAANAAGAAIRPHFRANVAAELKSDRSPVTIADQQAERAIRAVLAARFPDHLVFGEEFGGAAPGEGLCWVIDPIDGTRAFITGRPVFGTLIALLDGTRPVLGLIDQPVTGERWIGAAGMATRFTGPFGGKPRCRPCRSLGEAELSTTAPDTFSEAAMARWQRLAGAARRVSWGGDCY